MSVLAAKAHAWVVLSVGSRGGVAATQWGRRAFSIGVGDGVFVRRMRPQLGTSRQPPSCRLVQRVNANRGHLASTEAMRHLARFTAVRNHTQDRFTARLGGALLQH